VSPRIRDSMTGKRRHNSRSLVGSAAIVLAAIALGVYADLGHKLGGSAGFVPQLGAPWLAVAFAGGRRSTNQVVSATFGASLLVTGLLSYHFFKIISYGSDSFGGFRRTWPLWVVVALVAGSVIGVAGSLSLSSLPVHHALGWGVLAGAILSEGISTAWWPRPGSVVVGITEIVIASAAVSIGAQRSRSAATLFVTACAVCLAGLAGSLIFVRVL
jgi:hypothetical protein